MCFNESDNITLHSVVMIMTANRARMDTKRHNNVFQLFLSIISWKRVIASTQ